MASRNAERNEAITRGTGNVFADLGFPTPPSGLEPGERLGLQTAQLWFEHVTKSAEAMCSYLSAALARVPGDRGDVGAAERAGLLSSAAAPHHVCARDAERLWRRLRRVVPERRGVLILGARAFPSKARRRSAWRARHTPSPAEVP